MTPATETALVQALESTGLFKAVLSVSEAASQSVSAQITPAAYVGFDGFAVDEVSASKQAARITERWTVFVVAKQAKPKGQQQARSEALDLARGAFLALSGLALSGSNPLIPVTPGERPSWDSGFTWIPLAFTHTTVLKS